MTEIAPVGSSVCHVNVKYSHSGRKIILVEDPLELVVQQHGALIETKPAPGIERTALKLYKSIGRRRALLQMRSSEVCREITIWPRIWIGT